MRATAQQVSRRAACGAGLAAAFLGMTSCSSGDRRGRDHPEPTAIPTIHIGQVAVSGSVSTTQLREAGDEAAQAVERVRRVWGIGVLQGPLHIEVAANDAEFRNYGGGTEPGAQIAATTTDRGDVVLAPALFTRVTAAGRVVVLTHELTHVALHQATLTGVPHWIIEGSAEFTAYDADGKNLATLAPQVATAVRDGTAPAGPPDNRQFAEDPATAYQSAFVWCRFLAQRYGRSTFISFVRAADAEKPHSFESAFGEQPQSLRAPYQAFLHAQLAD